MNLLSSVRSCGTRDWKGTGRGAGLSVLLLFPLFESGSRVSGYSRSRKSSSNRSPRRCIISARMARIIKVNSPWKNTCQYASCTFFSLYSRKAKFLRLARERCRWTELYLKLAKIFADRVLISRGPFEDRVRFAFAGDCTLAIISTRHSGRRFIVTNVTVSYD